MRLATWLRRPIVWLPISIGLLVLLGWRSRLWEADTALEGLDPGPLIGAVALSFVVAILWAVRSADLFSAAGRSVGVLPLVPMTAFANTINNLTPGSAGEIVRMYLLRAHHGIDYATSGAIVLVERIGAMGYLAASALIAWLAWLGVLPAPVAAALAIAIVAAPLIAYRAGLRPLSAAGRLPLGRLVGADRWNRVGEWLTRVDRTIAVLVGSPRHLVSFAVLSGGIFLIYDLQLLLVGRALGVTIDPFAAWGALGLATTVGVLSLLPFGLGTMDVTLVALLGVAGVPTDHAVAMAFGYRIVSTLPLGIGGIASFAYLSARLPVSGMGGAARAVRAELGDGVPDFAVDP
jgi:glycosyltransferase 2 family protein